MDRIEACAEFARILLDDFESAESVCSSKSNLNLTKHELIIRRLNTYVERDRDAITAIISDTREECSREMSDSLKRVGKAALEGGETTAFAANYYEAKAKVAILDELFERIEQKRVV